MEQKRPVVVEPLHISSDGPSTIIFLHGLGDDAEGSGYGKSVYFADGRLGMLSCALASLIKEMA